MRIILLLLSLSWSSLSVAQIKTLKLASNAWPPFTDVEGGRAVAFDLVQTALKPREIRIKNTITDFEQVIAGIRDKTFAGSTALWDSPDRETYLLFSKPYLQNKLVLVGPKGSDVSAQSMADLAGKRVAIVKNYAYGAKIEKAKEVIFVRGDDDQDNLNRLLKREVDYILIDHLLIQYLLTYQKAEAREYLEIGKEALIRLSLHVALRRDLPEAEATINRFNQRILEMVADGTYHKILNINWIRTDVDKDGRYELVLRGKRGGEAPPAQSYTIQHAFDTKATGDDRYYINGEFYESWDQIPDKYKKPFAQKATPKQVTRLEFQDK